MDKDCVKTGEAEDVAETGDVLSSVVSRWGKIAITGGIKMCLFGFPFGRVDFSLTFS